MDFLGNLGGNTVAKMVGEKAGDFVEDMVEKAMGGDKKEAAEADKGGAIDQLMNLGGGAQKDEDKGLGLDDALSFVTGKDDKKDDGGGVMAGLGKLTDMF